LKTSKVNVDSQKWKLQGYKEQCLVVQHYEGICRDNKEGVGDKQG